MKRPLTPVTYESFGSLKPGRMLDRLIAENVLRYDWAGKEDGARWMTWKKGGKTLLHTSFRPSTDLDSALRAVEYFVDDNKPFEISISIISKRHWQVTSTLLGRPRRNVCSYSSKDSLPFAICQCLVQSYLQYGPKDYETFGWLRRRPKKGGA